MTQETKLKNLTASEKEELENQLRLLKKLVKENYWNTEALQESINEYDNNSLKQEINRIAKGSVTPDQEAIEKEAAFFISTAFKKAYALSFLIDKRYFSDIALFKFISMALAPAYKYLDDKHIKRLRKEIISTISDKKIFLEELELTKSEKQSIKEWQNFSKSEIDNYKACLTEMLGKRKKIDGINNKGILDSLFKWFNRNFKNSAEISTMSYPDNIKVPVDQSAGKIQELSYKAKVTNNKVQSGTITKKTKAKKKHKVEIPIVLSYPVIANDTNDKCATIYGHITSQDLSIMTISHYIYATNSNNGAAYEMPLDDFIRFFKACRKEKGTRIYEPSQKERNYYAMCLEKCFNTKVLIDIMQEYNNYLNKDQQRRMIEAFPEIEDKSEYKISDFLIPGYIKYSKDKKGKDTTTIIFEHRSHYMAYIIARDGYINYPYDLNRIILKDARGQKIKEPDYYYNFFPEIIRRVGLMKQGKDIYGGQSNHIISIMEDNRSRNSHLNFYQLCGVPSPSEASKGNIKKKYKIMAKYRKTIETILDNLAAYGYIKGWEQYSNKTTKSKQVTGYKIFLIDTDQRYISGLIDEAKRQKDKKINDIRRHKAINNTRV